MLGYDSFFSSHDFTYCFVWDAVKRFHYSLGLTRGIETDSESSTDEESEHEVPEQMDEEYEAGEMIAKSRRRRYKHSGKLTRAKNGEIITMSQFLKYINKGQHFEAYSLYDYSAIVRHKTKLTEKDWKSNSKQIRPGRKKSKIYRYEGSKAWGCPDDSFGQTISQKFSIPIIPGPAPPTYPGKKPVRKKSKLVQEHSKVDSEASKECETESPDMEYNDMLAEWKKKAKRFVEFYSLLLLPWGRKFDPRDPSNPDLKILPWNDKNSWKNFTTVFRGWDVDTEKTNDSRGWFRRSCYKIFTNMASNLNQSSQARKIMLAWRSQVADKKSELHDSKLPANISNEGISHLEETEKKVPGDDLQIVMDFLRRQHG